MSTPKWFKFYYEWCKVVKSFPDEERLKVLDFILDTSLSYSMGEDIDAPTDISPLLVGWIGMVKDTIKEDFDMLENANAQKREAIKKRWANKQNHKEETHTTESTKEQNESLWAKEFKILINRPEDVIISFCRANKLLCVNAYIAWCATFIETMKGEGRTHENDDDIIDHFHKWFYKLGTPKPQQKVDRYMHWIAYYKKIDPSKSKLIDPETQNDNCVIDGRMMNYKATFDDV